MRYRGRVALAVAGFVLAACLLAFPGAYVAEPPQEAQITEASDWVQIFDQQAVILGQLTPADPDSIVADWESGVVFVDYQRLSQDLSLLGRSGGFIQVVEFETNPTEGIWEVQNIPVLDPSDVASTSVAFVFDPVGGPISSRTVGVFHSSNAAHRPPPQATHVPPKGVALPQVNALGQVQFNPRGALINLLLQNQIPQINQITAIFPLAGNLPGVRPLTPADSVEQEVNQCAPAAVANSMEYLRRFFGIQDGFTNAPSTANGSGAGAIDPTSRVAALDQTMNRQRNPQTGTPTLNIIQGKLQYISNRNLGQAVVVKHQGRYCPTGNQSDPNCRTGNITVAGVTSTAVGDNQGAVVTQDFIRREIRDREDVELCFASARVAHCVHVTGYNIADGFLRLHIVQDARQGQAGGVGDGTMGHMALTVGTFNGRLWISNFPGGPALVTNVITESPTK